MSLAARGRLFHRVGPVTEDGAAVLSTDVDRQISVTGSVSIVSLVKSDQDQKTRRILSSVRC